jgi:hypothetical protein
MDEHPYEITSSRVTEHFFLLNLNSRQFFPFFQLLVRIIQIGVHNGNNVKRMPQAKRSPPIITIPMETRFLAPRAMGKDPRISDRPEHDNGTKTGYCRTYNGIIKFHAWMPSLVCKFHNENTILGNQTDQHDNADLTEKY